MTMAMKFLVVLVLLATVCEAFLDHHHALILRRAKRQISSYSEMRTFRCTQSCAQDFQKSKVMSVGNFCSGYNDFINCASECNAESSQISQMIVDMFDPYELVCNRRFEELVSYMPCYAQTIESSQQCSNKCGDPRKFGSETEAELNDMVQLGQTNAINAFLKKDCSFMSCHLRCASPRIHVQCPGEKGEQAAEFLSIFYDAAIQSVYNGLKTVAPGIDNPKDCLNNNKELSFLK